MKRRTTEESLAESFLELAKKEEPVFTDIVEFIKYDLQTSKDGLAWLKTLV